MGEISAIITAVIWAIGIFPFTQASIRMGSLPVNNFRLLLAMIILSIALYLFYGIGIVQQFTIPSINSWMWLGISGVVGLAIGDYFSFASFAILGPRLASIFSTISPGVALTFGFFLGNDSLNFIGFVGMVFTVAGVLLVLLFRGGNQLENSNKAELKKGLLFAFLSALCQGIGIVFSKMGLQHINSTQLNPLHAAWIRMVAATAGAYLLATFQGRLREITLPILKNQNKGIGYLIFGTMCGPVIGMSTSMVALSMISASIAQTIFSLVPVFVLLISVFYFKEKLNFISIFGSLVAIFGVVILIWRQSIIELF